MVKCIRLILVSVLALSLGVPAVASADTHAGRWSPGCMEDVLGNQLILICLPKSPGKWNGHLVVYAHGYMPPQSPLALPLGELTLPNAAGQPVFVPAILTDQGFAFVTSSYSKNGYAVEQAGNDLNALVAHFKNQVPPGRLKDGKVFITGASEGGLIATMLFETEPEVYDGAVALCGVGGGAPFQIQYLGDFRVVFDYYFPGVLPPSAANVPPDAFLNWPALELAIATAIASNPLVTAQLLTIPTVSPTKNSLVYFISIVYTDHPVWRSHREEAKRGPPSGHRITRNGAAMVSLLLPYATTGLSRIAGRCLIGATPRGQPRTPVSCTSSSREVRGGMGYQ